jgi:glutaminyl-tRNA synthetase
VDEGLVEGWDDPRMPTLAGLRRRGVTPGAIRDFCRRVGVSKQDNLVEMSLPGVLYSARILEPSARRGMAVLDPLPVVLTNYPGEGETSRLRGIRRNRSWARGRCRSGRELYIEREDFMEDPPKKYKRLAPGRHGTAALWLHHPL